MGRGWPKSINDQPHLRRFLRMLPYWGFEPKGVATDGSNLYPATLRRTLLVKKREYQQVPEREEALGLLNKGTFDKMVVFLVSPAGKGVKTNNHVERANRPLRFQEKVRPKWRSAPPK